MTHCPRCGKTALQPDAIHTCTPTAEPQEPVRNEFNRVINHAIEQGIEAGVFLRCWREGDWSGCKEFGFEPNMAAYTAPQPRKWLTDEEIKACLLAVDPETKRLPPGMKAFARAIEAAVRGDGK